jgi:hypothetical protein
MSKRLVAYVAKYGPGTSYNIPVDEIEKWYKLEQEEANRAAQIARFKKRWGI